MRPPVLILQARLQLRELPLDCRPVRRVERGFGRLQRRKPQRVENIPRRLLG